MPGSSFGAEPVARTTSPRFERRPSTSTAATRAPAGPSPWTTSIPRAATRPVTPLTSLSTIESSNAWTADQSGSPDALMPHSSARFTVSITAADCSRAFVGMHPRSRHVPPRRSSRSTSATRRPSCGGAEGGGVPPGPARRSRRRRSASPIRRASLPVGSRSRAGAGLPGVGCAPWSGGRLEAHAARGRAPGARAPSSGPFGGWSMPIEYEGALAEHRAVRERVGLFDLTHLGKVEVRRSRALGGCCNGSSRTTSRPSPSVRPSTTWS